MLHSTSFEPSEALLFWPETIGQPRQILSWVGGSASSTPHKCLVVVVWFNLRSGWSNYPALRLCLTKCKTFGLNSGWLWVSAGPAPRPLIVLLSTFGWLESCSVPCRLQTRHSSEQRRGLIQRLCVWQSTHWFSSSSEPQLTQTAALPLTAGWGLTNLALKHGETQVLSGFR